jgi:uncharacterized protein YkwD
MLHAFCPRFAVVLVVLSTAACGGAGGSGDQEPASQMGMTAAHNAARDAVMPAASPAIPPLTWSSTVADYAQSYSEQCTWKHSGGQYGENIYAAFGMTATPDDVVNAWVSEAADYDYATNTCTPSGMITECGHYTQVVWRDSLRLGCGMTMCTTGSPFGSGGEPWLFWVCDYDPPGNFVGQKPY